MAQSLYDLVVNLDLKTATFGAKLDAATRQFAEGMNRMQAQANSASGALKLLQNAIPTAIFLKAAHDITAWTTSLIASASALDDLSEATGSSVESLSRLAEISRISGQEWGKFEQGLFKLAGGLAGVDEEAGKTAKALAFMGISTKDPARAMEELALKMNEYEDGAAKAALARDLFGKGGGQFLSLLKDIAESQDVVNKRTTEQAAEAEKLEKHWRRLSNVADGLRDSILSGLVPALNRAIEAFQHGQTEGLGWFKSMDLATTYSDRLAPRIEMVKDRIAELDKQLEKARSNKVSSYLIASPEEVQRKINAAKAELAVLQRMMARQAAADPMWGDLDAAMARAAAPPKKELKYSGASDKKDTKEKATEYQKALEALGKQATDTQLQIEAAFSTEPITKAEKWLTEFANSPAWAKLSASEQAIVTAQAEWLAGEERKAARQEKWAADAGKYAAARAKEREDDIAAMTKTAESYDELVLRIEEEAQMLAMTSNERERAIALKQLDIDRSKGLIETEEKYLELRQKINNAFDMKGRAEKVQKGLADEKALFEKTYNDISNTLTDALMRGFEDGKNAAKNFRDTLVNMFKTLILRPMLQFLVQPLAGGMAGMFGPAAAMASGGASGGTGLMAAGSQAALGYGGVSGLFSGSGGIFGAGAIGNSFAMGSAGQALGLSAVGLDAAGGVALTGLGTALGAAIPLIGAAVAVAMMAGLFDKDPAEVQGRYQFGSGTGGFEDNASTRTAFGNVGFADEGTKYFSGAGAQTFNNAIAGVVEAFASRMTDEQIASTSARLQGTSFRQMEGTLTTEDFIKQYGAEIVKDVIVAAMEELNPSMAVLVRSFEGTADETINYANALLTLQDVLAMDPLVMAEEAIAEANMTAMDSFFGAADALREQIVANDMTTAGVQKLASASVAYAQTLKVVLAQIEQVKASSHKMFENTIRQMTLQTLTPQEKEQFFQGSFDRGVARLQTATDPTVIMETLNSLNQDLTDAFNNLDPDQQKAMLQEYVNNINALQDLADERLADIKDTTVEAFREVIAEVGVALDAAATTMQTAAGGMVGAAGTMEAAANAMPSSIDINLNTTNSQNSAVYVPQG